MDEWSTWRKEFPILETTTYLISNSLGAMPRAAAKSLEDYARAWAERGVRAWEEIWWDMSAKLADRIAPLIGAEAGAVSLHQNVTLTQAVIASCFDFSGPRRKIVLTDKEFPSVLYFWHAQRRRGAEIELLQTAEDPLRVPLEKLLAAIDERTLLVPISHVCFRSAFALDVAAVVEKAHRVGARVILDVYQSAGVMPVDVKQWNVDFAVGGTLKWLCGGPGVAFLYVRPDLGPQLEPALTGWVAHPRPFDFEVGPGAYRADSYRFMNGTPNVPALYAASAGPEIIRQIGVERIRRRSLALTRRLIEQSKERGWRVHTPDADLERGGTVTLDVPHGHEVTAELVHREILVDYRPEAGIRVSPHFYNTEAEIGRFVDAVAKILAG